MPTVYLVSANPFARPLKIDIEHRAIHRRLPASWQIRPAPAAEIGDLISDLRRLKPDIVHFSAHGTPTERLVLLEDGEPQEVSRATIDQLFAVLKGDIRLVILNACYSQTQAELIAKNIDCVIGVGGTLADSNAIKYTEQLYEALVARRSVYKAHQEASIILTDVPSEHKPRLIVKDGVDPNTVIFSVPPAQPRKPSYATKQMTVSEEGYSRKKREAFEAAVERYGAFAERLAILKIGNTDGSFVLRYHIENLSAVDKDIDSLCWRLSSSRGLVMAPMLDDAVTDAGISWKTEPDPPPASFEDVLENVGRLHGKFVFDPPLRPGAPRSFAWTTEVLNGDALTVWEFHNLYSEKDRVHVNGKPLVGKPSEFFAKLVWFPVRDLRVGLRLPPSQSSRPQLRYFELKQLEPEGIPVDQVLRDGELRTYPDGSKPWAQEHETWDRNPEVERLEANALSASPEPELTIAYPVLGSYYSVDWTLPDPALPSEIDRLRAETEVIREHLLAYRGARLCGPATESLERVHKLFAAVHDEVRSFLKETEPSFATSLMTWDREKRRMVVVDVCSNDGRMNERDWNFWVPFGLGLAGMCFRTATGAYRYQRDLDKKDPERPESYLPVPGVKPHSFVLSLPIDHPEMTEELGSLRNAQRCRQLVGVLSLSSRSPASRLLEYCRDTLSDGMFGRLRDLRDACQDRMDAISTALLEAAGVAAPVPPPQAQPPSAVTQRVPPSAGLIRQPDPGWVSPVRRNRFRYKVAAFDYDGTLLRGDGFAFSWELVWQNLQFGKAIQTELKREYRQRAGESGERAQRIVAYQHWCERAAQKFRERGLTRNQLRAMTQRVRLTNNCRAALQRLRKEGVVTALISGGISAILEDTFPDYRDYFDFVFINELLFDSSGVICGVRATAYDFEGKADALDLICRLSGATVDETVFVGDRFNDEKIMEKVNVAIAYPPTDPLTESIAHLSIKEDDLLAVTLHILVE